MTAFNLTLQEQADAAQQANPRWRARDLALHLGVSECALVHAQYTGLESTPLAGSLHDMFAALGTLGTVMALTRNAWCVHERHGRYENHVQQGGVHMMLGADIDLRAFVQRWRTAYAVTQNGRHSLQFFDVHGLAVHKVYATPATDQQAWADYVTRFAAPERVAPTIQPANTQANPPASAENTTPQAIRTAWLALQDTHEFTPMLRRLGVKRTHALECAGADLAQQVPNHSVEHMLEGAAQTGLPIMCFVSNPGMVQIHTGPVQSLRRTGDWYNVLDPTFSLHLNTTAVASSWVVNKPTAQGWVRSLELYHASGELIVQFFGKRKEGQTELQAWRTLLDTLCAQPLAA